MAASSLTVKRFLSSSGGLLSKSFFRPVASSSRSFNANANVTPPLLCPVAAYRYFNTNAPQHNQHRNNADHPSSDFSKFSKTIGALDEFLNAVYRLADNLIGEGFYVKENDDSLSLSEHMYGLEKEDVKIYVDHKILTVTFKGTNQNEGCGHGFYLTYDLNGKPYRINEIKAKIRKDGVLEIVVPKIKMDDEETHERIIVKIE